MPVTDLFPLGEIETLKKMQITGSEVRALSTLPRKDNLRTLSIYESRTIDLAPVGQLLGLETLNLHIYGPQGLAVSPVKQLVNLTSLGISGDGFQYYSPVGGLDAIDGLHHLTASLAFS